MPAATTSFTGFRPEAIQFLADLAAKDLGERGLRTVLDTTVRASLQPDIAAVNNGMELLRSNDWGMRADAVRVLMLWFRGKDQALFDLVRPELELRLGGETDPFVRHAAGRALLPPAPPGPKDLQPK